MPEPLFRSLDSAVIADDIFRAQRSVCYAAPGVQKEPAEAGQRSPGASAQSSSLSASTSTNKSCVWGSAISLL